MPTLNGRAARNVELPEPGHLPSRLLVLWLLMVLLGGSLRLVSAAPEGSLILYFPQIISQLPPQESIYPNDEYFAERQWTLRQIQAPGGWGINTGGEVVVAIIDSGVDYSHPDLEGRFVDRALWWDYVNSDSDPIDDYGHGTHVAGIVAANSNNQVGIAGLSWGGRILPLKVLDRSGNGYTTNIAAAIQHAVNNGAHIINLSIGGRYPNQALQDAITYARSRGVLVVAAAGNYFDDENPPSYPGAMEGVVAVAATTLADTQACYSNAGSYVDVAAPGGQGGRQGEFTCNGTKVWSTVPGGYGWKSGTSMATPHVVGLAALLLSERPSLTHDELEAIITSSADDLGEPGWDPTFGAGRVNARRALEAAWYLNHPVSDHLRADVEAPYAPATDCDTPHVQNHVLVHASQSGAVAAQRTNGLRNARHLGELPNWQLWEVPNGQACAIVQELNSAGVGTIAELDVLYSAAD